jgi:hypothetical protein
MTVSSVTNRKTFAGNSVTTSFATSPVVFFDTSDLVITVVTDSTGASESLVENTDYTVSGGAGSTGTVSLAGGSSPYGAPATGTTVVIRRVLPLTQDDDFLNNDINDAEVLEDRLDRLTMMAQQLDEGNDLGLRLSSDETATDALTVLPFDRANKILGFNSSKQLVALPGTVDGEVPVTTFMATVLDDTTSNAALTTLTATRAESGATAVPVLNKLRDIVSIKDFGAVGDGVTDDSAALTAAIASFTNGGGTVFFPQGEYIINSAVLIDPAVGRDFVANINFKGAGGHHTDIATRVWLLGGDAATAGMTLKSAVQMSFEDIDFVGASSMLALIKIQANGAIPAYSSFNISFRNCRFASTTPVKATVWVNNTSNVSFEQCFFQGAAIALQIGSNTADAENTGTFSGGTADGITLTQCFLNGDVVHYRCRGIKYDTCVFDENSVVGGRGARIYAAGDQLVRGVVLLNNWAGFGDDTGVFFTLGTSGYNLTAINNFFATYFKAIVLDGVGVAQIKGNEFALNSNGATAIDIDSATFYGDDVQNNNYDGMHATSYRVQDARSAPASPVQLAPLEVNKAVTVDYTITNHGTGYEDVLTQTVKLTGGLYRVQAMVSVLTGATASEFRLRMNLDSQNPYVGGTVYIPANTRASLCIHRDVLLEGTTGTTTARLQIYQVTGGTAATVKATDTVQTSMMQMTRAS